MANLTGVTGSIPVTLAAGATGLSPAIPLTSGCSLVTGILVDCTSIAWISAAITFQGSVDGTTFFNLYDNTNTEVAIPAFAISLGAGNGRYIALDPGTFSGLQAIKVRSGTSASAVNQTNGATLTICGRA